MAKILKKEKCIDIDGVLTPLNSFKVQKITAGVRLLPIYQKNEKDFIEVLLSNSTIDGVAVSDLSTLYTFFEANAFKIGGGDGSGVTVEYLEENYLQLEDVKPSSFMPEAGNLAEFSPQGLLSTGFPEFPENAVPLSYLNFRMGNKSLWSGTLTAYNAIVTKDPNTIYHITD